MSGLKNTLLALVLLLATFCGPGLAFAAPHIVVETSTRKIISQNQAFDRWYPASLTKLMTAYLAIDETEDQADPLRQADQVILQQFLEEQMDVHQHNRQETEGSHDEE